MTDTPLISQPRTVILTECVIFNTVLACGSLFINRRVHLLCSGMLKGFGLVVVYVRTCWNVEATLNVRTYATIRAQSVHTVMCLFVQNAFLYFLWSLLPLC